ncbi:urea active transporter 1 [Pestalotiopsis sp. NC0098]|nr:urea active transporter 1 [Pestalotiopsis sp. NC0098]
MSSTGTLQVLTPGTGYGLVVGLGVAFTVIMILLTSIQNRYGEHNTFKSTEEFNAASRSIKPGMIAAGIVSSWTHATTLLTSCMLAYLYGVSGGLWYGAVGTFQTMLFAVTAFRIKERSNNAHTLPEIVLAKHGKLAHKIYTVFGLITNVINGSALLTGGCGVFNALTGMNIWASYFILIVVVEAYIVTGGLRSTFICDYLHTVVLYAIIFIFMFSVYAASPHIGSPEALFDLLDKQAVHGHAAGTDDGSYFTVRSRDSLVFGATIFLAGFSGVWTDQAYWQRAIASAPHTAVKGYVLGSLAWYAVPFAMSTCMGLAAAALQGSDVFPVTLSDADVSAGLVAPAAAIALLGKSGACLIIVLLFMAVTSSTSAESIGASSLITFDIYKAYINPVASTRRLLWVSIAGLFAYGVVLAAVSCIFHAAGISLGWLVKIFGCLMGGASFPIAAVVLWDRTSTFAAQASPILGLVSGLSAWMVTTKVRSGSINITTTGDSFNSLAGDCVSLGVGLVSVVLLTFLYPEKRPHAADVQPIVGIGPGSAQSAENAMPQEEKGQFAGLAQPGVDLILEEQSDEPRVPISALNEIEVRAQKRLALAGLAFNTICLMVLLPFTLYGTGYTFSLGFFKAYVVVAFLWIWASACICVVMPIWEARKEWIGTCRSILEGTM